MVDRKNNRSLVQVCYSIRNPETKRREVSSLFHAMDELHIRNATVVTFEEEDTIKERKNTISVIPMYKFLAGNRYNL